MTTTVLLARDAVEGRSWTDDAACRPALGAPSDLWSADNVEARAAAMHVCHYHCPVQAKCDEEAPGMGYRSMVAGGRFYTDRGEARGHTVAERCPLCRFAPRPWPDLFVHPKTPRRRKSDRPAALPREPAPCGTEAGYGRHMRHGEPVDEACREARNARNRERDLEKRRRVEALRGRVA